MAALDLLRNIIGFGFLFAGIIVFIIEIYGIFHLKFVLNRMHCAAMGDTAGLIFSVIGLIILNGINLTSVKLILVDLLFMFSSPVCSHMLSELEKRTNKNIKNDVAFIGELETLERQSKVN